MGTENANINIVRLDEINGEITLLLPTLLSLFM